MGIDFNSSTYFPTFAPTSKIAQHPFCGFGEIESRNSIKILASVVALFRNPVKAYLSNTSFCFCFNDDVGT